jgi:hypothetical protein
MYPRSRSRARLTAVMLMSAAVALPQVADAADSDLDRALETLGIDSLPDQVRADIEAILGDALDDDDAIDVGVVGTARLENGLRRWELAAPDWRALPLSLSERVRACRDDRLTDPASLGDECGDRLRLELRLRQMEQARSRFEQRLAAAGDDPTALGDLDRLQRRVMERFDEIDSADSLERAAALGNAGYLDGSYQLLRDRVMEQQAEMDRRMQQSNDGMGGQS